MKPPTTDQLQFHAPTTPIKHPNGGNYPDWISEQIHANRPSSSRAATIHACPKCNAQIITGLNDDIAAWTIHADTTPLTEAEELAYTIAGRPTYTATITPPRIQLDPRDHHHMDRPATVVPAHQCWSPPMNPDTILPSEQKGNHRHGPQY